jgi:hypothetical protein
VGDDRRELPSVGGLAARIFHISLLILGAVIALQLAVVFLEPILPWIVGGVALVAGVWIVVAIVRWRRSRW